MVLTMLVTQHKVNGTSDNSQTSNTPGGRPTKGHMAIPYVQGLEEASSTHAVSMGFKHILKATRPTNKYLANPRTRTPRKRIVVLSTVTNVWP